MNSIAQKLRDITGVIIPSDDIYRNITFSLLRECHLYMSGRNAEANVVGWYYSISSEMRTIYKEE